MREYINLVESAGLHEIWVSPDLKIHSKGDSHCGAILQQPDAFGLDPAFVQSLTARWEENDEELDFEYLIALAEDRGWVRVSYDAGDFTGRTIAMSGKNLPRIAAALRLLLNEGYVITQVEVELDQLRGKTLRQCYGALADHEQIERFLKLRSMKMGPWREVPVNA